MKKYVKFSLASGFSLLLALAMVVFVSCEKEVLELNQTATDDTATVQPLILDANGIADHETDAGLAQAAPFDVQIDVTRCRRLAGGNTVEAKVNANRLVDEIQGLEHEKYTFKWRVDGRNGGTGPLLSCVCAKSATVLVTRLSDGANVRKTVRLSPCLGTPGNGDPIGVSATIDR